MDSSGWAVRAGSPLSLRGVVGVGLCCVVATVVSACTSQVITRSDEIVTRCTQGCYGSESLPYCIQEEERLLQASSAGCLEEYDAYFSCRDAAVYGTTCFPLPDDGCKYAYYVPLVKCIRASPAYEVCRQADERMRSCSGESGWSVSFDFCDGAILCDARCILALSCDEVATLLLTDTHVAEYDACSAACVQP